MKRDSDKLYPVEFTEGEVRALVDHFRELGFPESVQLLELANAARKIESALPTELV